MRFHFASRAGPSSCRAGFPPCLCCATPAGIAARVYPDYSLADHDISFLGHPREIRGWLFWSAGMGLAGLMLWPVTVHISRGLRALTAGQSPARRRLVAAAALASRCSSIGLVGLALIPQLPGLDHAHELAGVLAMGGMYVALWLIAGLLAGSPPTSAGKTWLLILAVGWGPAGFLLTQGWRFFVYGELGHDVEAGPQYLLLRFSLWEWPLFVCLFPALLLVVACLPSDGATPRPLRLRSIRKMQRKRRSEWSVGAVA